ncbi:hypothetical protein [Nocardia bhagyanarayanae]|uniref:Uncharacterized protein n=1 Tax=Nocardia bhagyanarayanae TaxID=1215925 RepID=A0A543FH25_9NOCA|nr:hypothetical protein [Nocardia bhagyanarayanae]TQM33157.1 hypothetical protein FB390_4874 [Nocardia bhagyanarayanae]
MFGIHTHAIERSSATVEATGTHAMLVFGTGVDCYLSYLPTFEARHNFQVLLAVELDEHGRRALGADRRIGYEGFHTFEPEFFPLTELNPHGDRPRTELRGTLYRGHLERGGPIVARDVVATVHNVVYFAELQPYGGDELLTHLCFGRPGRLYLAHRIARRPSFDQIVAVRLIPGTVTDMLGRRLSDDVHERGFDTAQPIILGQREFHGQRLRTGEIAVAAFRATPSAGGAQGFLAELAVERQIYLEVADLG